SMTYRSTRGGDGWFLGPVVRRGRERHVAPGVEAVGVQNRVESLFHEPAFHFLDLVPPLVTRQQSVETVEHLRLVTLLPAHRLDAEERKIPADPAVALPEEELDDGVEADHHRMGDEAQQACRHAVALTEGDKVAADVRHPPFRPLPVRGIEPD